MDRPALLHLYDEELRRQAPFFDDAMRMERDGSVVRLVGATADAGNNCVLYSQLDSASAPAAIAQQIDRFRRIGHSFEWKHHDHDQPVELPQLLLASGFVAGEKEACMAAELASWHCGTDAPPGYSVRVLSQDEGLDAVAQVQAAVWPELSHDWLMQSLLRERRAQPDAILFHAIWQGRTPVCVGWTRLHGRIASLFGGSTLAEHRHRGLYRALLTSRLAEAQRRGAELAVIDAGPMSRPILERLHFALLTGTTPYHYTV